MRLAVIHQKAKDEDDNILKGFKLSKIQQKKSVDFALANI